MTVPDGDCFPFVVDFNGDGLDDLIQGRQVILNTGSSFVTHDLGLPAGEYVVGVLDVNGDGIPDLLTDTPYGIPGPHSVQLYIGDQSRHYSKGIVVAHTPRPLIADVDGDGKDDLLVITGLYEGHAPAGYNVDVLRSRGDGTFDHLQTLWIRDSVQQLDPRVSVVDLDHDGLRDIVLRLPNDLVILHGTGGGKFSVEDRFTPPTFRTWGSWDIHVADIDGDGNADIVLPGVRRIRVLFGDGHGNFPRMATATIPQVHDLTGLPPWEWASATPDNEQPRDFAIGHFTRSDRTEIAAGLQEGDLVVYAYDQGALTEVARTRTEFFFLDIETGNFRGKGLTDIYTVGIMNYMLNPPPARIFYGSDGAASPIENRQSGRHRAAGKPPAPSETILNVRLDNPCVDGTPQRIVLKRDGVFGRADNAEAVFDDSKIYLRMSPAGLNPLYPLMAELSLVDGVYSGSYLGAGPACGYMVTVTATVE